MSIPENASIQIFATKHVESDQTFAIMTMDGMEMPDLIMVIDPTLEPKLAIKPFHLIGEFCYRFIALNRDCLDFKGDMCDTLPSAFADYHVDMDNPICKVDMSVRSNGAAAYYEGCQSSNVTPSKMGVYHIRTKSSSPKDTFYDVTLPYTTFSKFDSPVNVEMLNSLIKGNISIDQLKENILETLRNGDCNLSSKDGYTVKATANRSKAADAYRQMLDTVYHPVINTSLGNVNGVNTIYANSFNLANWINQPDMPEIVAAIAAHSAMDASKIIEIITAYYDRIVTHFNNGGSLDDVMEVAGYYVYSIEVDVMADPIRPRLLLEDLELTHLRYRQMLLNPIVADDEHKLSSGHYIIQTTGVPSNVAVQ